MGAVDIILKLLDLFVAGTATYEQIAAMRAKLQQFQTEGRDPTDAEWEALFAEISTDSAALDAADDKLNG